MAKGVLSPDIAFPRVQPGSGFISHLLPLNKDGHRHQSLLIVVCPREGFLGDSDGKESTCNAVDPGFIPGSERSPGEGNGNPPQYSCLENPMDREA